MNEDDGITKLIDGDIYYHYHYADYLYQELNKKDKEIERLNNIINELEEWLEDLDKYTTTMSSVIYIDNMRDKLKQLKEGEKNVKN